MRETFALALMVSCFLFASQASTGAAAPAGSVYCKTGGKIYIASSEDGHFSCSESFAFGEACFVGARKTVIDLINNDEFNWDEEWVESAHFMGRDSISYVFVDGPNELRESLSMNRCATSFFKP
jgi:hypothetical protein